MAGWRVAALIGNAEVIKAVYMLKTNLDSGHFKPVMEAAVAAMTGDQSWLQTRNEIYRQRRDVVLQTLHRLGWKADIPHASLYVWFAVPDGQTSANFTNRLLEQAHVSLTPGSIFGSGGEGYVRLSLTAPTEGVQKAMLRLEKYSENTPENQG
jgi:LL-diaminopimelate aminotransferase